MSSKSVLAAIVEHALSQEPCASCRIADEWQMNWFGESPEMFTCALEEKYLFCPWTGRRFPWTRVAGRVFIDYDKESGDD